MSEGEKAFDKARLSFFRKEFFEALNAKLPYSEIFAFITRWVRVLIFGTEFVEDWIFHEK